MFLLDQDNYYHVWFFTCAHIQIFFYRKRHSVLKLRVQELLLEGFFVSKVIIIIVAVSISENI